MVDPLESKKTDIQGQSWGALTRKMGFALEVVLASIFPGLICYNFGNVIMDLLSIFLRLAIEKTILNLMQGLSCYYT